ncbi:MAG: hypothetical protein KY410_03920 [Proteobacteria bacterium]|nr:hypothetical protein [Pseudomonadota bacterium]
MPGKRELLNRGKDILLLGLMLALLAGCGGGSDDNDDAGNPNPPPAAPPDDSGNDGSGDDDDDSNNDDNNDDDGTDDNDDPAFTNFQAASLVIGQQDFSGGEPHKGGAGPDAGSLNMPLGAAAFAESENVLFIADSANARVLGFNGTPDANNINAAFVLGQADFTTTERVVAANSMYSPEAVTTTGGRLMVTDTDLNRVTVYEGVPTSGDEEPVLVVGQASLDTRTGACDQQTLVHPHAHFLTPDGKLLVADAANNRVLVWNEMPQENGAPADLVLGQSGFENCSFQQNENFRHPAALWSDGEQLIVADSEKHRILIWNTFPTESFQSPDVIIGQSGMTNVEPNDDDQDGAADGEWEGTTGPDGVPHWTENGDATARTLSYPRSLDVINGKLYVADMDNHRVLVWNHIPDASFAPADVVIGQESFTNNEPNAGEAEPNERGFQRPVGVKVIGDQMLVTEWENSRVLVFQAE